VSQPDEKSQSKRRGWARYLTFLCVGSIAIWLGGFFAFAQHVDKIRSPSIMPPADGIVVWTGKGGGRLETGGALLQAKKGERLLISGVHKDNDSAKVEIAATAGRMRITPYPVERADGRKWYKSVSRSKRLLQEYSKLLLSYAQGRSTKSEVLELETPPLE